VTVLTGDCLHLLPTLPADSFDSCVTDPPYGLGFMGKEWDHGVPGVEFWRAVFRVLKPGAHLLAFSGTRTQHRMVCAIEDAGFEIRDQIGWAYGSGFPKSHNLNGEMEGWGTALKPAWEPICVARKPLAGTVAANVLQHGTGALNVDGCRVEGEPWAAHRATGLASEKFFTRGIAPEIEKAPHDLGRWPANLVHDGSDEVLACFPESAGGSGGRSADATAAPFSLVKSGPKRVGEFTAYSDAGKGSAARFFYCAKASRSERGEGNDHPTVKPVALMRWLIRLVTPPGGMVLDPFGGSGSTGIAAGLEQMRATLIEMSPEYAAIASGRINNALGIFA
jgi:hypothetical protein